MHPCVALLGSPAWHVEAERRPVSDDEAESDYTLLGREYGPDSRFMIRTSLPILIFAVVGAVPWLPWLRWRFSLRTLLALIAIVSIILGLVICTVRG